MHDEPAAVDRARFPSEYGERGGDADRPQSWTADVEPKLRDAPNYWVSTVRSDGRPHARPVDGVWLDGALCFGGSPETRWVRNLLANPAISVHLPGDDDVVVLEGTVEQVDAPEALLVQVAEASKAKYPQYYADGQDARPLPFWRLRPAVAYAWSLTGFPDRATRWEFPG